MNTVLFACDLDNTLIHSYKHKRPGDLCIEYIDGKEQGYINEKTLGLLKQVIKNTLFVPVTTRSTEQYKRIIWPSDVKPELAVVANGALLLEDSIVNEIWRNEFKLKYHSFRFEVERIYNVLLNDNKFIKCRQIDNSYIFAYCDNKTDPIICAKSYEGQTSLCVLNSGKKIYFFPSFLTKGYAVKNLKALLNVSTVICAGDSIIDVPMLNVADMCIMPDNNIRLLVFNNKCYVCPQDLFFDEFLSEIVLDNLQNCGI